MSVQRRGSGRRWRPLLVVLALLGLLWMHGLGTHGTTEPPAAAAAAGTPSTRRPPARTAVRTAVTTTGPATTART